MSGAKKPAASGGTKPKPRGPGKLEVQIAERCTVYVEGRAYVAGQTVELPKAEAEALIADGLVEA